MVKHHGKLLVSSAITCACLLWFESSAAAQAADPTPSPSGEQAAAQPSPTEAGLQDIVVTAERRSTNLQRTPIAVTALDGAALVRSQLTNLEAIASVVPSLKIGQTGGFSQITIRGIGIQNFAPLAESAVAVNLNDVYISRPASFLSGMFDVASIEVLRGPQGTLYGRNATAGSINIRTNMPGDTASGYVTATVGNYNQVKLEGAIGGPINDVLSVRVAGFVNRYDGWGKNITTGQDVDDNSSQAIRGTIKYAPSSDFSATFIAEHYNQSDKSGAYHYIGDAGLLPGVGTVGTVSLGRLLGGNVLIDSRDVANDTQSRFHLDTTTLTAVLEWKGGPYTVRSITGYREQGVQVTSDIDGTSLPLGLVNVGEPAHQVSQELQGRYDRGKLNLTVGAYYFHENDAATPFVAAFNTLALDPLFGIPQRPAQLINFANLGGTIKTDSWALFGQGTWQIGGGFSLTAGLRYNQDRKQLLSRFGVDPFTPYSPSLPPPADVAVPARTFSSATPRLALQYQASSRTQLYATYAQGFKSGSFEPTNGLSFEPEKLKSYELGLKSTILEGKVRTNLAAFYYDYTNLQVQQTIGLGLITTNAGTARLYGLEGEFSYLPMQGLELSLNADYLNTRYTKYIGADGARPFAPDVDYSGHYLNNAPSVSGNAAISYTSRIARGAIIARAEGEYSSRFYFTPANDALISQGDFAKLNLFLTYEDDAKWSMTAFVRNLTNNRTLTSAVVNTYVVGTPVQASFAAPRTYGLQAIYRF